MFCYVHVHTTDDIWERGPTSVTVGKQSIKWINKWEDIYIYRYKQIVYILNY